MPDDLVERLLKVREGMAAYGADDSLVIAPVSEWCAEAADRITALTARLAELERATPEEVVEMAASVTEARLRFMCEQLREWGGLQEEEILRIYAAERARAREGE